MDYQACLDYLFSQLPIYQRIGKAAYKADLNNTIALCNYFDNPQRRFKSIHIAGTNGKGSVSHMLASIAMESGLKTGLYTSPHLLDFRERIKINGEMIPQQFVIDFVTAHKEAVKEIQPSFFEWTVAMAFEYFKEQKVDLAIVETGMGGRLDSTNILNPALSIITNIGLDHQQFLGHRIEDIAKEKGGIIKNKVPVVIGEYTKETKEIFIEKAREKDSVLVFASDSKFRKLETDLDGPFQDINQNTVLHALKTLKSEGFKIPEKAIEMGLKRVKLNTGLRGRWDWIAESPRILVDMAHNAPGIELTMQAVQKETYKQLHVVWGMVSDKEVSDILTLLPKEAKYYFCQPKIPRAMDVLKLASAAKTHGLSGNSYPSVQEALNAAKESVGKDDLIFVGGSTFVVAEVV